MTRQKIHDNGGRPFVVEVLKGNPVVKIYKQEFNLVTEKQEPLKHFLTLECRNIWIGKKPPYQREGNWRKSTGNTILLEKMNGRFVYIGPRIEEFDIVKGDTIEKQYSEMGNSDVPYPVAIGKRFVYFFSDTRKAREASNRISQVPRNSVNIKEDLYGQLWQDRFDSDAPPLPKKKLVTKILHKNM